MLRSLPRVLSVLLVFLALACQARGPRPAPNRVDPLGGSGLSALQPGDIALAPLRNQTGQAAVPLDELRRAFYEGLIDRLYSPLELAYVDSHWQESAFAGAPPPDGLLVISMTEWDTRQLRSHGILLASAELRLFEGGSTEGPMLWGAHVHRKIDLGIHPEEHALLRDLLPQSIEAFAQATLLELPERSAAALER